MFENVKKIKLKFQIFFRPDSNMAKRNTLLEIEIIQALNSRPRSTFSAKIKVFHYDLEYINTFYSFIGN